MAEDHADRLGKIELAPTAAGLLRPLELIVGSEDADAGETALIGTDEDDEIRGLGGNDEIFGRGGNDALFGGAGNDDVRGEAGDDTISGGTGNDVLRGNAGADIIRGNAGNDRLLGGADNDRLFGNAGDDVLNGQGGDDRLFGGGGDDTLRGNAGDDLLRGGPGNDLLLGGAGRDTLRGNGGNDDLRGGGGNDQLFGGTGDDLLRGQGGNDLLDGGLGTDILIGGPGADTLRFTVIEDGVVDRVRGFEEGEDRFNLRPILPDFQSDDDLDQFVRFEAVVDGTTLAVDPTGSADFQPIALLEDVAVESLPASQLGLPTGAAINEPIVGSSNVEGEPADGPSFAPSLSTDGRFLTFSSAGTNLVGEDTTDDFDVYRKDIVNDDVVLVSDTEGARSDVSGDGSSVVWETFGGGGVFLADVADGTVTNDPVSEGGFENNPSNSDDGQRVAFETGAEVFVFERGAEDLINVSDPSDAEAADDDSFDPDISADGQWVVFASNATNLVQGETDQNPFSDIFIRAAAGTGEIELVSTTAGSLQGFGGAVDPSISGNGQFVAFATAASLVAEDDDEFIDIYLKDVDSGDISLISSSPEGASGDGDSFTPAISDDGRFVAFRSAAENLTTDDGDGNADIFVKDSVSQNILRFDVTGDTSELINPFVLAPALSGDGSLVAYVDDVELVDGSLIGGEGQVVVAPVDFGAGAAALRMADVLDTRAEAPAAPATGGSPPPISLEPMLAPEDIAAP